MLESLMYGGIGGANNGGGGWGGVPTGHATVDHKMSS